VNEELSEAERLAMLRRFEPVVRYTRGERFFPIEVGPYINACSLWVQTPNQVPIRLVSQGELTVDRLIESRSHGVGAVYYLKFIEPLDLIELARYSFNEAWKSITQPGSKDVFRSGLGRLARVGYGSRLVDALFSVSLLVRGRVPGDTAAAAALAYQRMRSAGARSSYYGRVVRQDGWVALQYWYFYPFNNWRTGFFGANDHEGDWEMACIYCTEDQAVDDPQPAERRLAPCWVAFASHEFSGDDLRRRWDDPELVKVGEHPVIFAGAGSHASYFTAGEYLAELELPFLTPLVRLVDRLQDRWVTTLRQAGAQTNKPAFNVFRIPFVDYARGDGLSIGPGQDEPWQACLLDEQTAWAICYRGLWGLYAQDPIAGENAPAGPVYNRDGSVRRRWYDPLGWAGLDKVPPPDLELHLLSRQREEARANCSSLKRQVAQKSERLHRLGIEAAAIEGRPHLAKTYNEIVGQIDALSKELAGIRQKLTVEQAKLEAFDWHEERLRRGELPSPRAHLHRAHAPSPELDLRLGGLAEAFSAISIGSLMIGIVLLIMFARQYLLIGLAAMVGFILFVEAGFRRQLARLINSLSVGLAIISSLVLLFEFFWQVVVVSVLALGVFLIWENLRELRS